MGLDGVLAIAHSAEDGAATWEKIFGFQCAMRCFVVSRCSRERLGRGFLGLMTYLDPKW